MEKGYGDFESVSQLDAITRLACFYASSRMAGLEVDWTSGMVRRPSSGTPASR